MRSNLDRRLVMLAVAVGGAVLLQACAVTTGGFTPSRSPNSNASMTSHYDVTHMQSTPNTPHSLMRTTSEKGYRSRLHY